MPKSIMNFLAQQRVFIVDDDFFCREMYTKHLSELGIKNIYAFNDGEACINNMFLNPNIIFVDYDMVALNGVEVIEMVKTSNPETYTILISAQRDMKVATNALKNGAFYYINKNDNPLEKMSSVLYELDNLIQLNNKNTNHTYTI